MRTKILLLFSCIYFFPLFLLAQLNGNYLIDPDGSGDYTSLSDAAADLYSLGMSGNVTLQLATALYEEQVLFEIPGQTENELLTIESVSGVNTDVLIRYEETTEEDYYQLAFKDIQALLVQNISFNTEGLDDGVGIDIKGNCKNVVINNIHHVGNNNDEGVRAFYSSGFFTPPGTLDGFTVSNSYFHKSSSSISVGEYLFVEPDAGPAQNIYIFGNEFFDADGVNIKFSENIQINENTAWGDQYLVQPIKLGNCEGTILIENNIFWNTFNSMEFIFCAGSASNPILIANNFISGTEELLNFNSNSNLKFVYNSVYSDDDSHLGFLSGNNDCDFLNNIFYQNDTEGSIFLIYFVDDFSTVDYNCMYSNGSYAIDLIDGFPAGLTYEEYKTATDREENGISLQPIFILPGEDLHTANEALNAALVIPEVSIDIDGDSRSTTTPTIGADEITGVVITDDLTIDTVITSGDLAAGEQLTIEWSGENIGSNTFNAPWIDRVFLSEDQEIDAGDLVLENYEVEDNLNAGASYDRQTIATIPLGEFGNRYIIVKVDAEAQLVENNSNNIFVSEEFVILPPDLPNLVVTEIEMIDSIYSGTSLQVNFTITNSGEAAASGNWTEHLWYEEDIDNYNVSSYHLINTPFASANNIVGLMPGESYVGSVIAETPYIGQGWHYIRVETDAYDNIVEEMGQEDNFSNAIIDSVFVNQSPLADLIINEITTPDETFAGEEISISYEVLNNGTQTTSPVELPYNFYFGYTWAPLFGDWVDYTYFSDTLFDFQAYEYEDVEAHYGNLAPDSSYLVVETIQIPECVNGPYFIVADADKWNHVAELNELNNRRISDTILIIPRPSPDLIIESIGSTDGYASNTIQSLNYTIVNQGADTANAEWIDRIYLSDSANFQNDLDEMVGSLTYTLNLVPDEEAELTMEFEIPPNVYGQKYMHVWLDAANAVCEQPFDTNNVFSISVLIEQSPSGDLMVSANLPESDLIAGDTPDLLASVMNVGQATTNVSQWSDIIFILNEDGVEDTVYKEVIDHTSFLNANDSYSLPTPFLIPLDLDPGFYSIGLMTDHTNTVWENESEENNILLSEAIMISLDSSRVPDLLPIDISSENWLSGETYTLTLEVKNNSAETGSATWIDEVYIATNTGQKLASSFAVYAGNLETDESYSLDVEVEVPLGTPSDAILGIRIDTAQNVLEYNTVNNIWEQSISVAQGLAPDFSPSDLNYTTAVNAGQEMNISLFRNNFGEVAVSGNNWIEKFLLSSDDIPSSDDYVLKSYAFIDENMEAMSSILMEDSIQIPLTLAGNFYLIYYMDANDNVNEGSNEGNNYSVSDNVIEVLTPAPVDFTTELNSISITDGNLSNIQYTITNSGDNSFTGKFYNTYYLSTDSVYSLDDAFLGWDQVADYDQFANLITLGPGASSDRIASFAYLPVIAGDYYIIQKLDALLNVYETDESNNTLTYGPVYLDNVEEIFPDITYDKQFGRNLPDPISINTLYGQEPNLEPDRHDYKITIPDGYGMITWMWENESANEAYGINNESQPIYEMYIGESYIPTPLQYDFIFDSPLQSEQTILVPVAQERTDYIKTRAPYIPPHFDPDSVPISQYHLRAEFKEFSVFSLHPEKVGNSHNVTLRIKGFDLIDTLGLDVALINENDTVYAFETYPQNSSELIAYIDMRDYPAGEYELMVRKQSSGDLTIWDEMVTVTDDFGPVFFSDVSAPSEMRLPNEFIVEVNYGNKGYSNEYDMAYYIAFFYTDTLNESTLTSEGINVEYLGYSVPGALTSNFISDESIEAEVIDYGDMGYAIVYGLRIPIMHARYDETLYFKVRPDQSGTIITQANMYLLRRSPYTFTGRVEDAGTSWYGIYLDYAISEAQKDFSEIAGPGCSQTLNADQMTQRLAEETYKVAKKARGATSYWGDLKKNFFGLTDANNDLGKRYESYKGLVEAKGELSITASDDTPFASELTDVFDCIDYEKTEDEGCWETRTWQQDGTTFSIRVYACDKGGKEIPPDNPEDPRPGPFDRAKTIVRNALDPNEIVGPAGEGSYRLISNDEEFVYTIYFENIEDATAPAVRVRIDNPISEHLRIQSLRINSFGFADTTFQFNNSPYIQETFNLGPAYSNQHLRIIGGTNPITNKAFFEFITIDPETQGIVTGANEGFLLPNDSTGRGQGFISYTINAKDDLDPGTSIENNAAIIFDENEVIETNTWTNLIKGGDLSSSILPLPEFSNQTFNLSWLNETPNFGPIATSYDIYFRDITIEEDWRRWIGETSSLSKYFEGIDGHTYEFFSRARSESSIEDYKNEADAVTTIRSFGGDVSENPVLFPNPASDATQLAFYSSGNNTETSIILSDSYGRRVYSVSFESTNEGVQLLDIPIVNLNAGVYVLEIIENNERKGRTKLVITGYPTN